MAELSTKLFIFYSFLQVVLLSCHGGGPEPVDIWFRNLKRNPVRKYTTIEVYVQDALAGPAQTVYEIAKSNVTSTSPTSYGRLFMSDDLLTVGPDPNSRPVGRAQGLVGFSDLNELALYLSVNFLFREGPYNGSTISVLGRNPILEDARELSIIGGTGVFRLAQGVAVARTYMDYNATGYGILKYSLYVTYY